MSYQLGPLGLSALWPHEEVVIGDQVQNHEVPGSSSVMESGGYKGLGLSRSILSQEMILLLSSSYSEFLS